MYGCEVWNEGSALRFGIFAVVLGMGWSGGAWASTCSTNFVADLACDGSVVDDRVYAWDTSSRVNSNYNGCRPGPGLHLQEGGERIYRFTCPVAGVVQFEMDEQDCDLDLFVVRQNCSLPNDCLDYDTRAFNGTTSAVQVTCVVGARYWVIVESYSPWYDGPLECPTANGGSRVNNTLAPPGFTGLSTYSDFELRAVCDEVCDDGFDNDADGDIDCDDSECPCVEVCDDGVDNDGDGLSDCGDVDCVGDAACCDADGDGYLSSAAICGSGTDCNDNNSNIRPGGYDAPADGVDGDCDGVDTCYRDLDGDGYGSTTRVDGGSLTCGSHPGSSANALDCNDASVGAASIYPGAPEVVADGIDQDCNGSDGCYVDLDGDDYGTSVVTNAVGGQCLATGLATVAGDCLDAGPGAASVNPAALEVCGGRDDDCDGLIDDADPGRSGGTTWYYDLDGDGYAGAVSTVVACVAPSGAFATAPDCRDAGPGAFSVNPAASELVADGVDQNCDGAELCWSDADGDGFGGALTALSSDLSCAYPGLSGQTGDCRDLGAGAALVNPDALEVCNTYDDDCDGAVDDADLSLTGGTVWYLDLDGDGAAGNTTTTSCSRPANGYAAATDCRDTGPGAALVSPGASELVGDGVDQDCDGVDACYRDLDGDGFGAGAAVPGDGLVCAGAFAAVATDCLDVGSGAAAVFPGAAELCDGGDNDCDGLVDDADPAVSGRPTWYADLDGDGHGGTRSTVVACVQPAGHTAVADDCDDTRAVVHPLADEVCDTLDNDCDGAIDDLDGSLLDRLTSWADVDGDGYGDPAVSQQTASCSVPEGWVEDDLDCDDQDGGSFPGAVELPYDGADQDCDGLDLVDVDGDGFAGGPGGSDCVDRVATVFPGAVELADGVDQSCDGRVDEGTVRFDDDGDGFTELGGDCDDAAAAVNPSAVERCGGVDDDCDGVIDDGTVCRDDDGDGLSEEDGDCNDADPAVRPSAPEASGSGVDTNCDGFVGGYDADRDGFTVAGGDCDDRDASVRPGAVELADGADQDCDGRVDEGTLVVDDDRDGQSESLGDCDDDNPLVYLGAPERPDNGRDDDCDAQVDEGGRFSDDDGDSYSEDGGDCDDGERSVFPYAEERNNGADDDCDGLVDEQLGDADADGWSEAEGDCDDGQGWANPGASEICDGIDNDCNDLTDEGCRERLPADGEGEQDPTSRGCATSGGVGGGAWGGFVVGWLLTGLRRRRRG
jgi:hypothetical protein